MVLTVGDIIKQVRWCIDEEKANISGLVGVDENDDAYMDNIIKAKVHDALRWCLQYAPSDMLTSDGSTLTPGQKMVVTTEIPIMREMNPTTITLPANALRFIRVRLPKWKKAVRVPIEEDSDKYVELSDETATATEDRPVAALIRTDPLQLELWPGGEVGDDVEISYVVSPLPVSVDSISEVSEVYIPDKLRNAYLYYIAFLLMSAYGDSRASVMLSIAKMNLGLTE